MAQSSLLTLRFKDYLQILRERGFEDKATLYSAFISVECMLRDLDPQAVTVKQAMEMLQFPQKEPGWDHFAWGAAVVE